MSFTPKIEKGVPIPGYNYNNHNSKGYAKILRALQPGDCVVLPTSMKALCNTCTRVLGKGQYVARSVEGGIRVWRKPNRSAMLSVVSHTLLTPQDIHDDQQQEKKSAKRSA